MKPLSYKRICAYVIDFFIITFLSIFLTYFLPENKEYEKDAAEYIELFHDYTNKNINQEEFVTKTNDVAYSMSKNSVTVTVVTTVLTTVYFVVYAYFMDGQTLGKKLMKLKIVSKNRGKLTMNNYLIRGLLANTILMNTLSVIFILGLSKETFIKVNDITTYIFGLVDIVSFGMILFREDKKGLHDIIAGTKVISISNSEEEETEEEVINNKDSKLKDAEIIGEKPMKM